MKKYGKYIFGIVLIIAIVLIFNTIYNREQKKLNVQSNENIVTNSEIENLEEVEENIEIQNTVIETENTVKEDNVKTPENETKQEKVDKNTSGTAIYEEKSDLGSTDKKQEAINLVKQIWGKDDTVTFRCDSVEKSGEYIIAVVSKTSAKVLNYFKVNLQNKTVIVDY